MGGAAGGTTYRLPIMFASQVNTLISQAFAQGSLLYKHLAVFLPLLSQCCDPLGLMSSNIGLF